MTENVSFYRDRRKFNSNLTCVYTMFGFVCGAELGSETVRFRVKVCVMVSRDVCLNLTKRTSQTDELQLPG